MNSENERKQLSDLSLTIENVGIRACQEARSRSEVTDTAAACRDVQEHVAETHGISGPGFWSCTQHMRPFLFQTFATLTLFCSVI